MGLFSGLAPKRVSATEFHNKVRSTLRDEGLSRRDVDHVSQIVELGINESGNHRGLDHHEIDQTIKTLRENRDAHSLSHDQIDTVDRVLREHL
jgi:hypothetical protein